MKATTKTSKKGRLEIGKWQFKFGFVPLYQVNNLYMFHFGIFKLLKFPPEGFDFSLSKYKGFWIRREFFIRGFEINL